MMSWNTICYFWWFLSSFLLTSTHTSWWLEFGIHELTTSRPFPPLPLFCQGLNFTSMGHSWRIPGWIPSAGSIVIWECTIVSASLFMYYILHTSNTLCIHIPLRCTRVTFVNRTSRCRFAIVYSFLFFSPSFFWSICSADPCPNSCGTTRSDP